METDQELEGDGESLKERMYPLIAQCKTLVLRRSCISRQFLSATPTQRENVMQSR